VVSSTPRPYFTPGKDPVPIVQEAGWVPGPSSDNDSEDNKVFGTGFAFTGYFPADG
jgi:hypothetical protein